MSKTRRNITTDNVTDRLIESHGLAKQRELSDKINELIKQEYGSITVLEQRRKELEEKYDRILEEKLELERELREIEKKENRLDNLLVENNVMQQIKNNQEYRKLVEEKVVLIKETERQDGSVAREKALRKNAEVLSSDLPFDEGKLREVLDNLAAST